ncbi:MAG TPA: hypothetical protein VGE00_09005 [Gammaproteobacteria bacterium]
MGKVVVDVHERNLQRWLQRERGATATLPPLTGRLIIPLINGLGYRTPTQQGVTNSRGEFHYQPGERVTFYLGDIELPAASAGPTVTPYDMGTSPHEPLNAMRLLFALAAQRNGTSPRSFALAAHLRGPLVFSLEPAAFARQPAVARLTLQLGCALLDEKTAVELLDESIARYVQGSYLEMAMTLWHNAASASAYRRSLHGSGTTTAESSAHGCPAE